MFNIEKVTERRGTSLCFVTTIIVSLKQKKFMHPLAIKKYSVHEDHGPRGKIIVKDDKEIDKKPGDIAARHGAFCHDVTLSFE